MSSKTFDKFLDQQIKILKSKASETEDVMGLLVGEPQTSQGGKKIKGTLAYAGVSLNNRLYLPEELKKGDGMTVPLILNHASTAGAEEELDRLPQEFRSGLEQGKEMRVGEVSLQWDPENLTLYYTGEVVDQFFQREVDDAHMAVSLGMYYDSDSPQVCDESCYTVIKGAEFHEVSLVYHPGFPIATIEAYEALQRKTRLGESLVKVKFNEGTLGHNLGRVGRFSCKRCGRVFFSENHLAKHLANHMQKTGHKENEGITDNLTFRNYNDPLRCKICGTQFFSEDHLAKHMKKTGHKEEEKPEREITDDLPPKEQPNRSYFSQMAKHGEVNVMANYEEDGVRGGYFICKRCGGTIRDIPKEETGQGKSMLELHIIGHDRDDKNKNARGDHKERYDDMKKWWEKPIAESKAEEDSLVKIEDDGKKITKLDEWEASEYIDGGRVWCDICGGSKYDHSQPGWKFLLTRQNNPIEEHDFVSSDVMDPEPDDPRVKESKAKAVEMPELVISRRQGENILSILEEELEELRAEEPKDYKAIGRVRLLIMKTRKEIFPDQDPYLTIDLDYKKLEDQESLWDTKEDNDNETRYGQWGRSGDPHDTTVYNKDGGSGSSSDTHPSNRTGAMRTSNYKHKHIEDSQSDNWSRGGYGDRREGQITHTWQMFRNQLKPFNPDDMERTFSLWINFAQNQGISYEKANQLWKDQDIESKKGSAVYSWEASWKHCKKCNQMRKFSQSYDHSTGTRVIDHKPDEQGGLYRINDGDPQPRYLQYCETCDTPDEDEVTRTSQILTTEVIFCDFCNKTFPENNWQKKEQHEQEVHGGKQSKLFDSQSLIRKDLLR